MHCVLSDSNPSGHVSSETAGHYFTLETEDAFRNKQYFLNGEKSKIQCCGGKKKHFDADFHH
jgi:hypothetical protein